MRLRALRGPVCVATRTIVVQDVVEGPGRPPGWAELKLGTGERIRTSFHSPVPFLFLRQNSHKIESEPL